MSLSILLSAAAAAAAINFKGVCHMNYAKECMEEREREREKGQNGSEREPSSDSTARKWKLKK